jgi:methyl-accepting chemotaxis protein
VPKTGGKASASARPSVISSLHPIQNKVMSFFLNLKIGTRLTAGFSILIALSLLGCLLGVRGILDVREDARVLGGQKAELLVLTQAWQRAIESNAARSSVVFFATNPAVLERTQAEMKATSEALTPKIKRIAELVELPEAKAMIEAITREREAYSTLRAEMIKRHAAGEDVSAEVIRRVQPAAQAYLGSVVALAEFQSKQIDVTLAHMEESAAAGLRAMIACLALGLLAGAGLAWAITRSVVRPLREAQATAEAIAQGDLTTAIETRSGDEVGQLTQAMARMQHALRDIVSSVRGSSEQIATGSNQIATGNVDLSQRTEEQASSLQETAASMQQLTSTVRMNSDAAREASELAGTASSLAAQGGKAVGQAVQTMEAITASSRQIADIITVIDGIAFQTNILALNAAVEAARAGDQGRGFAVVASEVRNLAQRSADAAKEIKSLIHNSVQTIETGSSQVVDAGRTMDDVVAQVARVNELIARISSASQEQSQGIGQVGTAVTQLDQATQQNAALVEQSAAAAESLRLQAARLVEAVGIFTLSQGETREVIARVQESSRAARPAAVQPARRLPAATGRRGTEETSDDWQTF